MRLHTITALLLTFTISGTMFAQQQKNPAKTIAPGLRDYTVAIVRVNLDQLDPTQVVKGVLKVPGTQGFVKEAMAQYRKKVEPLKKAGVKEAFVLFNMAPLGVDAVVVAVPVTKENAQAVTTHFQEIMGARDSKRIGDLLLFSDTGLREWDKLPNTENPNLAPAFAAVAGADIQVVMAPSKLVRKKLVDGLPNAFPAQLGNGNPADMAKSAQWLAVGANFKAPFSIEARMQLDDPKVAKQVAGLHKSIQALLAKVGEKGATTWSSLLAMPKVTVEGKQVIASLDQKAILDFTTTAARQVGKAAKRMESVTHLKQLGLAMHIHLDAKRTFPQRANFDADGKPLLSWRVHILPYIGQKQLYDQFKLDEPWDSPHNKKLIAKMPKTYASPLSKAGAGKTTYLLPVGKNTMFGGKALTPRDLTDGFSNTIMIVEANDKQAVIWTKPDDLEVDPKNPIRGLVNERGVFNAAKADGTVSAIALTIPAATLNNLFQYNDGNAIELP